MEPTKVRLLRPVTDFRETIGELVISREVEGGDLLAVDGMLRYLKTLTLIHRLYRTPEGEELSWDAIKRLGARDIAALDAALLPFAESGPQDGGPSSADSPSTGAGPASPS